VVRIVTDIAALTVDHVSKRFGDVSVLHELSLTVAPRELCVLLGPSGCGKTTLLRIIAGFERIDQGHVYLGRDLVDDGQVRLPPERRGIGVVPQEGALFPHLNVAGNVGFGLGRAGRSSRVDQCLEMVGLAGFQTARPSELSGGQQQRVAVARALAPGPKLLLLDEPFAALDANLRVSVRDEMVEAIRHAGTTVVMVTHDRDEALTLADRIGVMLSGSLRQFSTPADIYRNPADAEVAALLGDVCLLPAHHQDGTVTTSIGAYATTGGPLGSVLAIVRPEQVTLEVTPVGDPSMGAICRVEYFGHDGLAHVALNTGDSLKARVAWNALPAVGDRVTLTIHGPLRVVAAG
jgi:iron(III) transport system ATP-binding protein